MGNEWDERMTRAKELSQRPRGNDDRLRYGEGPPDDLDVNSLPVDARENATAGSIGTDSALRWPQLRSAQEAARRDGNNLEVPAQEAPGDGAQPDDSEGETVT